MEIDPNAAIERFTQLRFRKLFKLLAQCQKLSPCAENENAVAQLQVALERAANETKQNWTDASQKFNTDCIDDKYLIGHGLVPDAKAAKRSNEKLYNEVKRAKRAYERNLKLLNMYMEVFNYGSDG